MSNVLAEYITKTIRFEGDLKGEEVLIKKMSLDDQKTLGEIKDEFERGVETILRSVVRWSFKNEKGQPIAVSKENIGRLRADIVGAIGSEVALYNKPIETKKVKVQQ